MNIKLAEIAEVKTGYTQVSRSTHDVDQKHDNEDTALAVGLRSISNDGEIDLARLDRVYTPRSEGWLRKVAESSILPGDLIVAARGSSGKAGVVTNVLDAPVLCTNNVLLVRPNPTQCDAVYLQALLYSLYSNPVQDKLRRGVLGQWSITRTDLEELKIWLPPLEEQRKIADAFSSIHQARRAALAVSDHYSHLIENLTKTFFHHSTRF